MDSSLIAGTLVLIAIFCVVAVVSERFTPLVGVGGLLLLLALGELIFH